MISGDNQGDAMGKPNREGKSRKAADSGSSGGVNKPQGYNDLDKGEKAPVLHERQRADYKELNEVGTVFGQSTPFGEGQTAAGAGGALNLSGNTGTESDGALNPSGNSASGGTPSFLKVQNLFYPLSHCDLIDV